MPTPPQTLETRLVTDIEGFAALHEQWTALYDEHPNTTIFSSWEWLYTWWEVFSKSGRRELLIGCFYDAGRLVGIAPMQIELRFPHSCIQGRTLRFLASGERQQDCIATPFLDLLALPGYEAGVVLATEEMIRASRDRWSFACFDFLLEDALIFKCCVEGCDLGKSQTIQYGYRYSIPKHNDRDGYIDSLRKRWRKDYRKKHRLLNKDGLLKLERPSEENIDSSFDTLKTMHRDRWENRASYLIFESELFSRFHKRILQRLVPQNKAGIHVLSLDDRPLACYYALEDKQQVHYYQSAFYSQDANRYMPLFYLVCNEIGDAVEEDKNFDFMFDESAESYKQQQYAAEKTPMYRMIWAQSSARLGAFNMYRKIKQIRTDAIRKKQQLTNCIPREIKEKI